MKLPPSDIKWLPVATKPSMWLRVLANSAAARGFVVKLDNWHSWLFPSRYQCLLHDKMNLSDTSTEVTPTKTNRSDLQYSPRDELDLSLSNSSQTDTIVSITAWENAQLRTENERLEQENEKLEQENERLEQENVHLKKELARLNGTNLQERRCLKPWSQLGREQKRHLLKDILWTVQNVADHYDTSVKKRHILWSG